MSGYQVEKMIGSGYKLVGSGSAKSFTDTGLAPSTSYQYRVRSYKGNKYSNYSTTLTVTTLPTPPPDPIPIPPDPACMPILTVSNDQLLVINAQPVAGLALVQATLDGKPYGLAFQPTPLQPFGATWEFTPTIVGNFAVVIPTLQLANGCHTVGAFATDTAGQTGVAAPMTIEVRN